MKDRTREIYRRNLTEIKKIFSGLSAFERETFTEESYRRIIEDEIINEDCLSAAEMKELVDLIYARTRSRLGILMYLVDDPEINEIMINGKDNVFVETKNGI